VNVRDRIGLSDDQQRRVSRVLQLGLVGLVFIGLDRVNPGIIVNAGLGLAITYLPALLERDYHIQMDPGLTLWITTAVFLHALGTVGLPGTEYSFYTNVWWWDHLTHMLSATIVAAAGYTAARAFDVHSDAVDLPRVFMFVFILLFVIAFGVFWEVIEFAVSGLADLLGNESVLTQYGLGDTLMDLVFDTIGGVIVATWGTAHLSHIADVVARRFGSRR
jgi:hypothetical protein